MILTFKGQTTTVPDDSKITRFRRKTNNSSNLKHKFYGRLYGQKFFRLLEISDILLAPEKDGQGVARLSRSS